MQENKYFYQGIPLAQYCKEHNINISTIRARIWKMRNNKKYDNLSLQEIVNIVIESYGNSKIYMYNGISLREYCLKNGISYETIFSRIKKLKKENEHLSDDELIVMAMENFKNRNYRFFYQGIPLKEYCYKHPEIDYNTIRGFINNEKKKNPELTDEELIEIYIDKEHKGRYKLYYLGIPLKEYCQKNYLNYTAVISYLKRERKKGEYNGLSDDEFIVIAMDKYQPFAPKYLYKGTTLWEYCSKNDLSYYSVVSYVKRALLKWSDKSVDELIEEAIETVNRYGIIYYYQGMPLIDYAKKNNLNASSIRCAIWRRQAKTNQPLQEIVNECVESYQKFAIKYYYNGESLLSYCNKIGLNYNTVIQVYLDKYSENLEISTDEAIKQIVDYYLENPPIRTKYYFNDLSLSKFCNVNGYSYFAIWRRIRILQSKEEVLSDEQIIEAAIRKYEDRLQINKINAIFKKLEKLEIQDYNELSDICKFLKIDFDNILDLINMDFSCSQAINLIWYFSDKSKNGIKIITDKKLKSLFSLVDNLKTSQESDIKNFELYDLIGIYKSGLYDSRNEILIRQKRYIYHTVYSICNKFNIAVDKNNLEDFISEVKLYLITVIDRTNLNVIGQIIKYMDLTVKGMFKSFLVQYKRNDGCTSLDEAKYKEDSGDKNKESLVDFIPDTNNPYENLDNSIFSETLMQVLKSLSKEDVLFIMLKFQENYNDQELADYFKISIEEVREKEMRILSLLKNNESVQKLRI